jgi:hypothetical protein
MAMQIIVPQMRDFMTPRDFEEIVDQPLYHIQSYGTAGATIFTFYNTAVGSATNLLSDTNMDASAVLSAGKRFAAFGLAIAFFGSAPHVNSTTAAFVSPLNDAKNVLEGIGYVQFKVLDKVYYIAAPLAYNPAGFGTYVGGASQQNTQTTAANGVAYVAYGVNGMPVPSAARRWRVPIPIPQQVRFEVTLNFNTAITVGTASRIGCYLDGVLIRAKQ